MRRVRVDVVGREVLEGGRWERGWGRLVRVLEGVGCCEEEMGEGAGEGEGRVVVTAVVRADDAMGWERVRRILEKGIWCGEAWRELNDQDDEGEEEEEGDEEERRAEGSRHPGRRGKGPRRVRIEVVKSEVGHGGGGGEKE